MSFAKMLPALAVPVVAVAAAIPANADQFDFVSMLDDNGVYYSSIMDVIDSGKQVCRIVRTYGTPQSVDVAVMMLSQQGYGSSMDRAVIIGAAANSMCPDITPQILVHNQAVRDRMSRGEPVA
jgi:hypothetical protein